MKQIVGIRRRGPTKMEPVEITRTRTAERLATNSVEERWAQPNRRRRRRAARCGVPKMLYGLGLGMSMTFLLWAIAMIVTQAGEAAQAHIK